MDTFHILVNPNGASGNAKKDWLEVVEPFLIAKKIPYQVHYSSIEYDMGKICNDLTNNNDEVNVIIIGGDGSINGAINGVKDFSKIKFGLIPCGSGNDMVRDMNLPNDRKELMETIFDGKVKRLLDIGEVIMHNTSSFIDQKKENNNQELKKYFNVACGMGFDAEVVADALKAEKLKSFLNKMKMGKMIYTITALTSIFKTKNSNINIIYDDGREAKYEHCLFVAAMNHQYEGGGFKFCPNAISDDGLLDVCLANPKNNMAFFRIFPSAYEGKHIKYDVVKQDRCKSMRIKSDIPLWVHTDGEVECKSSDITIKLSNQKIQLLM